MNLLLIIRPLSLRLRLRSRAGSVALCHWVPGRILAAGRAFAAALLVCWRGRSVWWVVGAFHLRRPSHFSLPNWVPFVRD